MTFDEPVAYMWKTAGGNVLGFQEYKEDIHYQGYVTPLYTAEDLHPRVKMTQAEFDEFIDLYGNKEGGNGNVYFGLDKAINLESFYPSLNRRLISDNKSNSNFSQVEFANLWIRFNPDNPEETIDIIPNMKWFVRSNEKYQGFYMFLGNLNELRDPWIFTKQDNFTSFATQFDTKEEAEKWTNPLTEAVQLPVEDE